MKYREIFVWTVTVVAGSGTARAQFEEYTTLMHKGAELDRAGNYTEALATFQAAVRTAQHGLDVRTIANTINATGLVYDELGRLTEAMRQYRRVLALLEQLKEKDSLDYAVVLGNLGADMLLQGGGRGAEKVLREAIAIGAGKAEPHNRRMAVIRTSLAQAALESNRLQEAEGLLEDAIVTLRIYPQLPGQLAIAINNLGVLRRLQKRSIEAEGLFQEAIKLTETELSPSHPRLLQFLNNLALAYIDVGRLNDADSAMRRAMNIAESRLEPQHPTYGSVMLNYAFLLRKMGRKAEGKQLEARAKALIQEAARTNGDGMIVDVSSFRR